MFDRARRARPHRGKLYRNRSELIHAAEPFVLPGVPSFRPVGGTWAARNAILQGRGKALYELAHTNKHDLNHL